MVDAHYLWLAPFTDVTSRALRKVLPSRFVGLLPDGKDPNHIAEDCVYIVRNHDSA